MNPFHLAGPSEGQQETGLDRARRRHGKSFGVVWPKGEGPRVFNAEALARLKRRNEELRTERERHTVLRWRGGRMGT